MRVNRSPTHRSIVTNDTARGIEAYASREENKRAGANAKSVSSVPHRYATGYMSEKKMGYERTSPLRHSQHSPSPIRGVVVDHPPPLGQTAEMTAGMPYRQPLPEYPKRPTD